MIQEITSRHEAMIRKIVLEGYTSNQVCMEFDITPSYLSIIRNQPLWKQKEDEFRKEALRSSMLRLEGLREKAINALEETVQSTEDKVKLGSAREILNRTGLASSIDINHTLAIPIKLLIPRNWNNPGEEGAEVIDITAEKILEPVKTIVKDNGDRDF